MNTLCFALLLKREAEVDEHRQFSKKNTFYFIINPHNCIYESIKSRLARGGVSSPWWWFVCFVIVK